MILRRGVNGVLGQLVNEGLLTEAQLEPAKAAAAAKRSPTPWFVRALIGAGAWVSAGLIILFLGLADALTHSGSLLVFGVLFYAGGVAARRLLRGDFPVQLSLAAGLAGASMLVFGFSEGGSSAAVPIVASFAVAVVTIAIFPDVVMRFIATGALCLALVLGFHELELGPDGAVAGIAVAAGLAWHLEARLLQHPLTRPMQRPVAWGLVVALLGFQLSTVLEDFERGFRVGPAAAVSVAIALLVVVIAVAREHGARLSAEPVAVALVAVVALGGVMLRSPGVLAALYVAALAFHRRSPLMLGLAVLFLVVFLVNFYFRLEQTLLLRSLVLLGSGALLLALREYVRRRFGPIVVEELP